jgi:hypothetical protein
MGSVYMLERFSFIYQGRPRTFTWTNAPDVWGTFVVGSFHPPPPPPTMFPCHIYLLFSMVPDSERHSISDRTVNTGALLFAQIHGYLLGLKLIKTLIVGLEKI